MRVLSGLLLILLFPVLIIGAIYLWRKRAASASTAALPTQNSAASNAAQQIQQTSQQVTKAANAATDLINAFGGLIPSNDDYTPDSSEIRMGEGMNTPPIIGLNPVIA